MTVLPSPGAYATPRRGDTLLRVESNRLRQPLQVVADAGVDRQVARGRHSSCANSARFGFDCSSDGHAERLLVLRVDARAGSWPATRTCSCPAAPRERDVDPVVEQIDAGLQQMGAALHRQRVDRLQRRRYRARRRRGGGAEVGDAGDRHRRTDDVVDRRAEPAVRVLRAQLR